MQLAMAPCTVHEAVLVLLSTQVSMLLYAPLLFVYRTEEDGALWEESSADLPPGQQSPLLLLELVTL